MNGKNNFAQIMRILVCPACRSSLDIVNFLFNNNQGECLEGVLYCQNCKTWYPITNGIPRLIVPGPLRYNDRSFIEKWWDHIKHLPIGMQESNSIPLIDGQVQVQAAFEHKWNRQKWWGMVGESAKVIEEWLLPRYGWLDYNDYLNYMKNKHIILDAGCGLGRETVRMASANPDALVIGLELSACIDEALLYSKNKGINNIFYIQADLTKPPFKNDVFDFILTEGVLHHTPNTQKSFETLVTLLKENGEIGIYVYRKKPPIREFADDYVREKIKDLPPEKAWELMEPLTILGKILSELRIEINITKDIDVLGIKAGKYDIQRFIYYNLFKCFWNERLTFEENVHVNFDWYYPSYAWRHTEEEVRKWFSLMGLKIIHECIEESGITIRGQKNDRGSKI